LRLAELQLLLEHANQALGRLDDAYLAILNEGTEPLA
jgi:hypothetical protein